MNKTKLTVKDSALSFLVGFLLCQLAVVVVMCLALVIFKSANIDTEQTQAFFNTSIGYLIISLSLYLTMLFVFLFFNRKKENKIFNSVKPIKILLYIFIALASFVCLYPIITCIDSLLVKCGAKINTLPYNLDAKNYFISLITLVVAPAICEELLFRGIIFQGLRKHGKVLAITISSIMFSIYHMAISQTIYPILIGLLLGVIMFYEENIYYCIAVHLTNNFTSLTLSYFNINLAFNHWSYIILAIILLAAFICCIVYFIIKKLHENEKQPIAKNERTYLITSLVIMTIFWIFTNFS